MELMDKYANTCKHNFVMLQYNTYYEISRQNGLKGWFGLEFHKSK